MASMNEYDTKNKRKILITQEPQNILATVGEYAIISFGVSSPYFLTLQWFDGNCSPIASQNQSSLIFRRVKENDFGWYRLLIVDCLNHETVFTNWVELKKRPLPPGHSTPEVCVCCRHQSPEYSPYRMPSPIAIPNLVKALNNGSYVTGSNIILSAKFENATTYQWYKNKQKLHGYTRDCFLIMDADLEDTGVYTVKATNLYFYLDQFYYIASNFLVMT